MSTSNLPNTSKWQQMLAIVHQNTTASPADLTWRLRKLFISRLLAENVLTFLLQYIGLMLSTLTTLPAPAWLASGIACGLIFMRGYSILPGIWLGSLLAFSMSLGFGWTALASATLFALQAFLLLLFSYRHIRPTLIFYRQTLLLRFFILSSVLTALTSFVLCIVCFHTFIWTLWLTWTLANLCGVLLFSFALNTLDAFFPQIEEFYQVNKSVWVVYGLLMTAPLALVLFSHNVFMTLLSGITLFITIIIVSKRFGWCGSITSLFVTGFILDLGMIAPAILYTSPHSLAMVTVLQILLLITSYAAISIGISRLASEAL